MIADLPRINYQMAPNEPRRAKTAPDGPRRPPDRLRQSQMAPEEPQIQVVDVV